MVKLTVDGKEIEAKEGQTVLQAAADAGIYIPNLCYQPEVPPTGSCRMCIVEIEDMRGFPTSCTIKVSEGMKVTTNSPKIQEIRKNLIWLYLTEHPRDYYKSTQFGKVIDFVGLKNLLPDFVHKEGKQKIDLRNPLFVKDFNRCILCGRCVRFCQDIRGAGAIGFVDRGIKTRVTTDVEDSSLRDSGCRFCEACVEVCPSGALYDRKELEMKEKEHKLQEAEKQKEKLVVPCKGNCPAGTDIPRYVRLIAEGKYDESLLVIRTKFPFPHTLGLVCHHPCEEACKRCEVNDPISVRVLKRFVAERDTGEWKKKIKVAKDTGKKIAIVGAGPAGLTAGYFLRMKGHDITIFEAMPKAGGMMRAGIPKFRLPRDVLDKEVKDITDLGVKIKYDTPIEKVEELKEQGFDAVFLAIGAWGATMLGMEGEDDPRVFDGITMLKKLNYEEDVDLKGHVGVIGGGNVAIDVARCALRAGAKKVTILYRRTREEMPANDEEIEEAQEEGIKFNYLMTVEKVHPNKEHLEAECIIMKLSDPDESGRRRPVPVKGSNFMLELDYLIEAVGQKPALPCGLELETDRKGYLIAKEDTMETSIDGVFVGGDIVTRPDSVIRAIECGRIAASSIDKYVGGDGEIEQELIKDEADDPFIGRREGFAYEERVKPDLMDPKERMKGYPQVECCVDEDEAKSEASRCLKCQLRLQISKPPFPPDKSLKEKDEEEEE